MQVRVMAVGLMIAMTNVSGFAQDDADILAGPQVRDGGTGVTDFHGQMRRPDARPEELAINAMTLSEAERAAVDAILVERARRLDRIIASNLALLTKLGTAGETGDRLDQLTLGVELLDKLRPLSEGGSLRKQISDALLPESRRMFDERMREYWRDVVRVRKHEPGDDGRPLGAVGAALAESFELFGEEAERSFRRQAESGQLVLNLLLADLNLTDQQEHRIAAIVADFIDRTQARPSEQDQLMLGLSVVAFLDQTQRTIVLERIRGLL